MKTYMGCNVTRSSTPGYALPWSAYVNGRFVYADTLTGIKELIRVELAGRDYQSNRKRVSK